MAECDAGSSVSVNVFMQMLGRFLRNLSARLSLVPSVTALEITTALWKWPWDGLKLSHAQIRPGSNLGLPKATSRLFAPALGQVAHSVSGGFSSKHCMCIPALGETLKLRVSMAKSPNNLYSIHKLASCSWSCTDHDQLHFPLRNLTSIA
jgi:hypothetical protein